MLKCVFLLVACVLTASCAAAHGNPVLGGEQAPEATGTIAGTVRAAGSNTPLPSRLVTAINVTTKAKYEASTAANGGYTLRVPMGRYRLQVELEANEVLSTGPGEIQLNRSDIDSDRDFIIAIKPPRKFALRQGAIMDGCQLDD